ncbi:hypothetical protein G6F35_015613 [Rhizopus arrhizus]|nr:hypothetical protein G6F35_015613 [Rhizopus arrhizus]
MDTSPPTPTPSPAGKPRSPADLDLFPYESSQLALCDLRRDGGGYRRRYLDRAAHARRLGAGMGAARHPHERRTTHAHRVRRAGNRGASARAMLRAVDFAAAARTDGGRGRRAAGLGARHARRPADDAAAGRTAPGTGVAAAFAAAGRAPAGAHLPRHRAPP